MQIYTYPRLLQKNTVDLIYESPAYVYELLREELALE